MLHRSELLGEGIEGGCAPTSCVVSGNDLGEGPACSCSWVNPRGVQAPTAVLAPPNGREVGPAGSSPVPWGRRCVCGGGSNNRCGSLFRGTPERTTSAQSSTVTIILHAASRTSFMHVRETGERHGAVRGPHAPADRGRRYVHTTSETLTWALRQVPSQVHATKMPDGSTPLHPTTLVFSVNLPHAHTRQRLEST